MQFHIPHKVLVFDIETIPDLEHARTLHPELASLDDQNTLAALYHSHHPSGFLPHYLHKIVAVSVVYRGEEKLAICSLGNLDCSEAELIQKFFSCIEKYQPTLVSWNGAGFDLPVLHYRALLHSISAPQYWENGDNNKDFKFNNYLSRYHHRHLDLMDLLSLYQNRAWASLHAIATLLGFPGKMGIDGSQVWDYFRRGELSTIRDYCETDVLNTYLVYLRFELMRGKLLPTQYQHECDYLKTQLRQTEQSHLVGFLNAWQS